MKFGSVICGSEFSSRRDGEDEERQLETGLKLNVTFDVPVLIFATIWPSWFSAAIACGFQRIFLHVEDSSSFTRTKILEHMRTQDCWMERKQWIHELRQQLLSEQDSSAPVLVLVQGPETTALKVKSWINDIESSRTNRRMIWIAGLTDGEPNQGKFERREHGHGNKRRRLHMGMFTDKTFRLNHATVGGVVHQTWHFIGNLRVNELVQSELIKKSPVQSRVTDYLSKTEKGRESEPPSEVHQSIPWKGRQIRVVAPNVFAATKWVTRKATVYELMDMYDVGRTFHPDKDTLDEAGQGAMDFTQQIPMRVLMRCLETLVVPMLLEKEGGHELENGRGCAKKDFSQTSMDMDELQRLVMAQEATRNKEMQDRDLLVRENIACKDDDAEIRVEEWNERACNSIGMAYQRATHQEALEVFRKGLLRRYRHHKHGVIGSFKRFMVQEYGEGWLNNMREVRKRKGGVDTDIVKSYDVGIDGIRRAVGGTFWEWSEGSTILFWRWPQILWRELRDGVRVWFRSRDLPQFWGRQHWPEDEKQKEQLQGKVRKVLERGYIEKGYVKSLTSFFAVPKGESDIRVVYDATRSGLNDAIWTPSFFLPTMTSVLANSDETTFYGDLDLGEMFLNYFLDPKLRLFAGVDITGLLEKDSSRREIARWNRSLMGVRSSPFNCVRIYLLSEDVIKGDHVLLENPFRWDRVIYNLPGTAEYDPTKPWLYKFDDVNNRMASFIASYVDDLRTGSQGGAEECNRVTHWVSAKLNYLGQQDAARKRKSASQRPGPWAGAVMEAVAGEGLYVATSLEKWKKMQSIMDSYVQLIEEREKERKEVWINRKRLERDTGFLVHMFMAYENMRPYLKGFYLTLNGWRFDRDEEGWKLGKRHWEKVAEEHWEDSNKWEDAKEHHKKGEKESELVRMVPQMKRDVHFLKAMFVSEQPAKRLIRGMKIARLIYGFGDASGAGFGSSWVEFNQNRNTDAATSARGPNIRYRFGRWGSDEEGVSSNFRELCNLVESVEEMSRKDELSGVEVFLFTDNSTAEAAFNRGSSSSPLLYGLVKRVKLLEMCFRSRIHVIHVAGTRMIGQGTDGLSRGCLGEGVMKGESMLSFVPLHRTALERCSNCLSWLQETYGTESKLTVLSSKDWFWRGHDITGGTKNVDGFWVPEYGVGQYVWAPPPCVAVRCIEELRKARHKRQVSTHVFMCPRIMTVDWQRHLYRSADLVLIINPGHPAWDKNQHEPLIIGIYFPYLRYEPWQLKGSNKLMGMAGHLQRVCKEDPSASGRVLRQLWDFTRKLSGMPELVVRRVLQGSVNSGLSKTTARKRRRTGVEEETG